MTPEGILKKAVLDYLNGTTVFYLRINSGIVKVRGGFMHLAPEGTADVVVFPSRRVCWVEIKPPGQKTQKARAEKQEAFRVKVLEMGHEHLRCESVEQLEKFLEVKRFG